MDESDIDAAIEATGAAVIAAAERQGFHQAEDAWTLLDDKANVTDEASIERAVKHLAKEKPFLVDPYQQPPPPPQRQEDVMTEPVDDQDRQATVVKALVTEAATQSGLYDPQDVYGILDPSVMITDMASALAACDQLADAHPCLVIPIEEPDPGPPPPTPGPGPCPHRWPRRKRNANEQMLDMLKSGRD